MKFEDLENIREFCWSADCLAMDTLNPMNAQDEGKEDIQYYAHFLYFNENVHPTVTRILVVQTTCTFQQIRSLFLIF